MRPARRVTSVTLSATMKDGVEADAELPDELCVLGRVGGQALEELARPRLGDGADVLDDFLARHADAVVGDGDRAGGLVVADADLETVSSSNSAASAMASKRSLSQASEAFDTSSAGRSPCCRTGSESSGAGVA